MKFSNELDSLLSQGLIDEPTYKRLKEHYSSSEGTSHNRLLMVFAVLGSVLIGLGLILLVAHNWDSMSETMQTVLAFVPLLISQGLCFYVWMKRSESIVWKESVSAALFLSFGAVLSLVAQIYHLEPNLNGFLYTWILICLPLVYVFRTVVFALLWLIICGWFGILSGYDQRDSFHLHAYWIMMAAVFPFVHALIARSDLRGQVWLGWLFTLAVYITAGSLGAFDIVRVVSLYILLDVALVMYGSREGLIDQRLYTNPFLFLGVTGLIVLSLIATSHDLWKGIIESQEMTQGSVLSVIAILLLLGFIVYQTYINYQRRRFDNLHPVIFLSVPLILLLLMRFELGYFIMSLCLLADGIYLIYTAAKSQSLARMNLGLCMITALMIIRFFDADLSFVVRGLAFVICGLGFLGGNLYILKMRKGHE